MTRPVPDPGSAHPGFPGLKAWHYNLIMADPPWKWSAWSDAGMSRAPEAEYGTMPLDTIKALPVRELAWKDCILWLWAHPSMLPQALDVIAAWGFTFTTTGVWVKRTPRGKLGFGKGHVLRNASEPFLIGTLGKPATARNVRSVIESPVVEGPVREHSRKPDEAYEAADALRMGPKADLFSRQSRPGWDAWGLEAGKFDARAEAS